MLNEIFDPLFRDQVLKVFISIVCGLIIGVERTYRGKPAGVRTNMLICLGACLFMVVSEFVSAKALAAGYANSDPARIAAQVVTGIGFLGAGTILRNKGIITGLTSSASIWVVAAIGLAVGAGLWKLALTTSIMSVIAIEILGQINRRIGVERFRYVKMEVVVKKEATIQEVRKMLRRLNITYSDESTEQVLGETNYRTTLYFSRIETNELNKSLSEIKGVRKVILLNQAVE